MNVKEWSGIISVLPGTDLRKNGLVLLAPDVTCALLAFLKMNMAIGEQF